MVMTLTPSPGPVGTIVIWPKEPFAGVGGPGRRRSIVVANGPAGTAEMEWWSRPSKGWRRHVRKLKARRKA